MHVGCMCVGINLCEVHGLGIHACRHMCVDRHACGVHVLQAHMHVGCMCVDLHAYEVHVCGCMHVGACVGVHMHVGYMCVGASVWMHMHVGHI